MGKPPSEEYKKRISDTLKKKGIKPPSRIGCTPWNKGKKWDKKTKEKMSEAKLKNPTRYWLGKKNLKVTGENNKNWKGDLVGYNALHTWVSKWYGKPKTCEHCQKTNLVGRNIDWANKSGRYKRDREDWLRLCKRCHALYDKKTPDFCKCGDIHFSKGMCSTCYMKNYKLTHKI